MIKNITTEELKRMTGIEGLVLQGCGGSPEEWVTGINELLAEEGILPDGATFSDIYVFEHDGHTNILFSMEDVRLDIGKLAMWRLQSHDTFGGTWLSDYLPNRLGVAMDELAPNHGDAGIDAAEPEEETPSVSNNPLIQAYIVNTDDMTGMFSDINRLTDGDFAGKWHTFPTSAEKLQAVLKEIGVDSVKHKNFHIHNYYTDLTALHSRLPVHADIDEFNYLAARLGEMTEAQRETLEAVMQSGRHCGSLKDIINVDENLECFDLQPAYSTEQYGEFLLDAEKDNTAAVFDRLEHSEYSDERALARHILRLEAHVDAATYGRNAAELENGVFTAFGYLTESEGFTEIYRGVEDIPAEYRVSASPGHEPYVKVENTDLSALVYKIHALAGEHMADAQYNIKTLTGLSAHYLMLMNDSNIFLCEMGGPYYLGAGTAEAWRDRAATPDLKAFTLDVTGRDGDSIWGNLTEIDHAEQREDIRKHSICFTHLDAKLRDGTERTYTPEQWEALELIDRDKVQSWAKNYNTDDINNLISHLEQRGAQLGASAKAVSADEFLTEVNSVYMERAENPQTGMLRVTLPAAKELLVRGDCDVYRLLPDGAAKLSPIDAVRTGLWFRQNREFAIKREDAADVVRNAVHHAEHEKPKSHGEEL